MLNKLPPDSGTANQAGSPAATKVFDAGWLLSSLSELETSPAKLGCCEVAPLTTPKEIDSITYYLGRIGARDAIRAFKKTTLPELGKISIPN